MAKIKAPGPVGACWPWSPTPYPSTVRATPQPDSTPGPRKGLGSAGRWVCVRWANYFPLCACFFIRDTEIMSHVIGLWCRLREMNYARCFTQCRAGNRSSVAVHLSRPPVLPAEPQSLGNAGPKAGVSPSFHHDQCMADFDSSITPLYSCQINPRHRSPFICK